MMDDYVDLMRIRLAEYKAMYGEDEVKVIPYHEKSCITNFYLGYNITLDEAIKQNYKIKDRDRISIHYLYTDKLGTKEASQLFKVTGNYILSTSGGYCFYIKNKPLNEIILLLEEQVLLQIYNAYHESYGFFDFIENKENLTEEAINSILFDNE